MWVFFYVCFVQAVDTALLLYLCESAEEFKDKVDEVKEGGHVEEETKSEEEETKDEGDNEDEERKKASELWKLNLNK